MRCPHGPSEERPCRNWRSRRSSSPSTRTWRSPSGEPSRSRSTSSPTTRRPACTWRSCAAAPTPDPNHPDRPVLARCRPRARVRRHLLLLHVLPHDEAIAYATSRRFTVNQVLGVLEVRDEKQLQTMSETLGMAAGATPSPGLFDHVKDSQLRWLGIDDQVLPIVRLLARDAHLDALQHLLPTLQYDALVALASGMSPKRPGTRSRRTSSTPNVRNRSSPRTCRPRSSGRPRRSHWSTAPRNSRRSCGRRSRCGESSSTLRSGASPTATPTPARS